MSARWFIAVAMAGLLPSFGAAQPSPEPSPPPAAMSLAEVEGIALSCNPTLVQASMRVRAAEGSRLQAGLYPNPVVGYRADEIGDEGTAGFQGAAVSQELVTAGKLRLDRAAGAEEVRQAQAALEAQRLRVLNDVRAGFYDALAAQRTVELYRQLVAIAQESLKTTEKLLAAKEKSRVDMLQSRIEARSATLSLENAVNQQAAAWRRLAAMAGRPEMPWTALTGSLEESIPQLTWEEARARLLAESPELAEAEAGVRRAEWSLRRQYAERVPNLQLQSGVFHDNQTGYDVASAGVGLALPVFNRNQGNIDRAQAELTAARKEVDRVQLDLQQRLAAAFQQFDSAGQQVEKYTKEILPDARESLELVRKGYRAGEFNYLTLLTAQRTYFQTSLSYIESLRALRSSSVAIEGMLLSGGLNAGAGPAPASIPAAATLGSSLSPAVD